MATGHTRRERTDLAGADDEYLIFDGAGPKEELPVGRSRRVGECGRNCDHGGPGEGQHPVELGEADVVAEGQSEDDPGSGFLGAHSSEGDHTDLVTGGDRVGLPERDASQGHVEEMDLPIGGEQGSVGPDQAAGVGHPVVGATTALGKAAGHQVDRQP